MSDQVFGHMMQAGKGWKPLLPESSSLFCDVVGDRLGAVEAVLELDAGKLHALFLVLHWADASAGEAGKDAAASGGEAGGAARATVAVKHRSLLMMAAQSGSLRVLAYLLAKGAEPSRKAPDGLTAYDVSCVCAPCVLWAWGGVAGCVLLAEPHFPSLCQPSPSLSAADDDDLPDLGRPRQRRGACCAGSATPWEHNWPARRRKRSRPSSPLRAQPSSRALTWARGWSRGCRESPLCQPSVAGGGPEATKGAFEGGRQRNGAMMGPACLLLICHTL